nr:response regulator transcription factor [Streptomyces sulphureus]
MGSLIASGTTLKFLGESASASEGIAQVQYLRPSLVISELEPLRGPRGCELLWCINSMPWSPRLMVFSATRDPAEVVAALSCGADSFVHKSIPTTEVLQAIERTNRGESVLALEGDSIPDETLPKVIARHLLTDREGEVLRLLLGRCSNGEIASALSLTQQTVKNYVSRVFRKIGVKSRRQLRDSIAAMVTRCQEGN